MAAAVVILGVVSCGGGELRGKVSPDPTLQGASQSILEELGDVRVRRC